MFWPCRSSGIFYFETSPVCAQFSPVCSLRTRPLPPLDEMLRSLAHGFLIKETLVRRRKGPPGYFSHEKIYYIFEGKSQLLIWSPQRRRPPKLSYYTHLFIVCIFREDNWYFPWRNNNVYNQNYFFFFFLKRGTRLKQRWRSWRPQYSSTERMIFYADIGSHVRL